MASPIFLSSSSPTTSLVGVLRGLQLAMLGIYRGLQTPIIASYDARLWTSRLVKDTILIRVITLIPIVALWAVIQAVSYLTTKDYSTAYRTVSYIHYNVVNINFVLINFVKVFRAESDRDRNRAHIDAVFMDALGFFGPTYGERFAALQREASTESIAYQPTTSSLFGVKFLITKLEAWGWVRPSPANRHIILRYTKLVLTNCLVYLISISSKFGPFAISLMIFHNLFSFFGLVSASLMTLVCFHVSPAYNVSLLITFNETKTLVNDLIMEPYFSRMPQFAERERNQWRRSRSGVLFGYALFFNLLINHLPLGSLVFLVLSKISLGYLITKITEPPPNNNRDVLNWTATQLLWNKAQQQHVLNGDFTDDAGFAPIPGSFLI